MISQILFVSGFVILLICVLLFASRIIFVRNVIIKMNVAHFISLFLFILFIILHIATYGIAFPIHFQILRMHLFMVLGGFIALFLLLAEYMQLNLVKTRSIDLLEALIGVIEVRDPNLEGHSLHVRNLSLLLYYNLPFSYRFKLNSLDLQYIALLIDIGKMCIPSSIIEKSGKLGKEELLLIRNHPLLSENVLLNVKGFEKIARCIKYHHERFDGKGTYQLKGEEIPLASRIVAVADTFSALTMNRTYKPSLSYEEAISELRLVSGSQLDKTLVEYFCSIPLRDIEKSMEIVKAQMQKYSLENCMTKQR